MIAWLEGLPGFLRFVVYVIIAVVVVLILAYIVGKLGGFDESFQLGHFHLEIGAT